MAFNGDNDEYRTSADAHDGGLDLVQWVRDALRGRLLLAIAAGLVLAGALGYAGHRHGENHVFFTSRGIVRVVPSRAAVLYRNEFNERLPAYESYRRSQATQIGSQRVLEWAVADDRLRDVDWPSGRQGLAQLIGSLEVQLPRSEEHIIVSVRHREPKVARAAVDAVLSAYERLSGSEATREYTNIEQNLVNLERQYRSQRDTAREEARRLAKIHGTDDLLGLSENRRMDLERINTELLDLRLELARLGVDPDAEETEQTVDEPVELSVEQLAGLDRMLGDLIRARSATERDMIRMGATLRPGHRQMKQLQLELDTLQHQIDERETEVRATMSNASLPSQRSLVGASITELTNRRASLGNLYNEINDEVLKLGDAQQGINRAKEQAADADRLLIDTRQRLEELRVEQGDRQVGRAEIVQWGEQPLSASSDGRRKFGAVGVLGGGVFGVALVAAPGLIWRRFRSVVDVEDGADQPMLLGAFPLIGEGEDPELTREYSHHIRGLLDAEASRTGAKQVSYAVTSALAGEGKTSVTLALGTAFADAGHSVAIVDADLIGRRLTSHFSLHSASGVAECLSDKSRMPVPTNTSVERLRLLPAGGASARDASTVSRADLARVVERLSADHDVVLVDTGPILGSQEAAAAACCCDKTLLVISRGQRRSLVHAAHQRLKRLGVPRVGVIFNRARRSDLARHPESVISNESSYRSQADGNGASLALTSNARADGVDDRPRLSHSSNDQGQT